MRLISHPTPAARVITATLALALSLMAGCSSSSTSDGDARPDASSGDGDGRLPDGSEDTNATPGSAQVPGAGAASGNEQALTQDAIARQVFDPTVTRFTVHAYYEAGAEPYTGRLGLTANDTWDITGQSYKDLFAAHAGRHLSIPTRLDQMTGFVDQGTQNWNIGELIALGESMMPPLTTGSDVNIAIVFVNGQYDGNDRVLGIHPTNSPFAFVFKDVVRSVGGDAITQRYIEQATVVHEIGHAIGFVDNGVPMVNAHEDDEHPHHTVNTDGVMYWAVESKGGALTFVTDLITGARLSLFGSQSLLDGQNYMPGK